MLPAAAVTTGMKEALKGEGEIRFGATLVFSQPGGGAVVANIDHVVDDAEFSLVSEGEDVMLFLSSDKVCRASEDVRRARGQRVRQPTGAKLA